MLAPHSSGLLMVQWDWGSRPVLSCRHDRFGLSPGSALWRGSQRPSSRCAPRLSLAWT